ncbi:MAG: response regulator transcription factor [Proteobacteria bacterium]|nr:response regulator transcription factor [Pseudomonadota bacterium]
MIRCLVVDDDAAIRDTLRSYLQGFEMAVQVAADGEQMRRLMRTEVFDVAVIDIMLPGEDGLALTRWVQQAHGLPVLLLTARGDAFSRVAGLEMGADDYLAKPFEPRELVARIQAVVRRLRKATPTEHSRFAGWQLDRGRRLLTSPQGVVLPLSSAEFRLLSVLVEHLGRVLSRERLLDLTRAPGIEASDRSIDLAVSRLRAKLGDAGLIRTVRGEGYMLDAAA